MNKNRQRTLIVLSLVFAIAASTFAVVPSAAAHDPAWAIPTWMYVSVSNNVIGVNQELTIVFWLNEFPPTASGAFGDRWTFTVEVTKPDNSKETLGPFTSDPVGSGWAAYTPTQVGTYTVVAKFAEHTITGIPVPPGGYVYGEDAYINDIYQASTSDLLTFTVQEEQVQSWRETPLPTSFWTRPLNNMNRNWDVLAGNWLSGSAQNVGSTTSFGYGVAPESAHVMWATPYWAGGTMDARFDDVGYYTGQSYEGFGLNPPIILDGKLYYTVETPPREGWYCLDLYTGEVDYFHNTTGPVTGVHGGLADSSGSVGGEVLSFGQIYNYESPNQHGGFPYLWSTNGGTSVEEMSVFGLSVTYPTWMMFDAYTGNYICSIANVSTAGTQVYGKDGSILYYNINDGRLTVWNTSRAIWYEPVWFTNEYWMWRPDLNNTFDGNNGYSLNVSIPEVQGSILAIREDQYVIGGTSGKNNGDTVEQGNLWALSLKAGEEGTLLWNITYTPPQTVASDASGGLWGQIMSGPTVDPEDGVFTFAETLTRQRWGYSLETGQQLWGPTEPEPAMNYYGMDTNIYKGMLLSTGYSGVLMAYDIKTGEVLWNYTAAQEGFESPYGNYPLTISLVADGKIYLTSSEHSPTMPLWRGSYVRCVNASNGAELWKINCWASGSSGAGSGGLALGDGFIITLNLYDNQIYCFGKGPSATTAYIQNDVISQGSTVLIKGTVTDQSAGAEKLADNFGFVNGVPAVADEDMQAWMEYIYMQQAKPTDAAGVKVHLTAVDPNGNFQDIGYATSDLQGDFALQWTPPVPGMYKVTATFEGSAAYYGSQAGTSFYVTEETANPAITQSQPSQPSAAPAQTPVPTLVQPTPESSSPSEAPQPPTSSGVPAMTYVAIGAAVVVVVAVAVALLLRRRK
ncbi:MAG: PQQ-binding-like beta-propeller repeat protein [Candidatus Bathyarchaeota archaeon]|nr:PQQ-binding-like beta-propeller repeat protein [Candidatus Bathyarchaeota archaeon]